MDAGHPDLAGKIAASTSFVPDQAVQDGHGHGTHSATAWRIRRSCPAPTGWSNSANRQGCCRPCRSSCWWSTDAGRCCR
nr:hypothetical protein [Streptomyces sp. Root1310]